MSAFVVDDRVINEVVSWLILKQRDPHFERSYRTILEPIGYHLESGDEARLAHDMFDLNVRAVDARYGPGQASEFRELNFKWAFTLNVTTMQIYKFLRSWLYQCSEGTADQTPLWKAMRKMRSAIAEYVVETSEEYAIKERQ